MLHRCASGLLVRDGAVLLGLRAADRALLPGVWDVFGGHIEAGEAPHQTLLRELREELGVTAVHGKHQHTLKLAEPTQDLEIELWWYVVTVWEGTPTNAQPHEHERIAWFTYDEAVQLPLAHPSYAALFMEALLGHTNAVNTLKGEV